MVSIRARCTRACAAMLAGLVFLPVASLCQTNANTLSSEQLADGWELLFDGETTAGWTGDWEAVDGVLQRAGGGMGSARTEASFTDFHLSLEFYIEEDVNSGVFVRCPEGRGGPRACYELNIFDDHPDGYYTGSIVNVAAPLERVQTVGQWNTYDILVQGNRIVLTVNGVRTVDIEDGRFPGPGQISLQHSGDGALMFRNMRIKRL